MVLTVCCGTIFRFILCVLRHPWRVWRIANEESCKHKIFRTCVEASERTLKSNICFQSDAHHSELRTSAHFKWTKRKCAVRFACISTRIVVTFSLYRRAPLSMPPPHTHTQPSYTHAHTHASTALHIHIE